MTAAIKTRPPPLTARPAWKALADHYQEMRHRHLRQLFADDPRRGERMTAEAAAVYLDYSKHRVTDATLGLLLRLAEECGLARRIDAMFSGEKINVTEHRAALHVALRAPKHERILVDGVDVVPGVHAILDRMAAFCDKVVTENGWFAGRPSGTEDIYKLYAESFRGADHLKLIQDEAQAIIRRALSTGRRS